MCLVPSWGRAASSLAVGELRAPPTPGPLRQAFLSDVGRGRAALSPLTCEVPCFPP